MTSDDLHHDVESVLRSLQQEHASPTSPPPIRQEAGQTTVVHPPGDNLPVDSIQFRAVTHLDGPMRVMAPAGSGKTRTLVSRINHLLEQGIPPDRILALAFNRKAQEEMNERLSASGRAMNVRTFHSFGYEIIRRALGWEYHENSHPRLLGLLQDAIIHHVPKGEIVSTKPDALDPYLRALRQATMELIPLVTLAIQTDIGEIPFQPIFQDFLVAQIQNRFLNFDGMIYHALRVLIDDTSLRHSLQNQFEYVLVDEFQDLNRAQMLLTQIIALPQNNLFVVGDDDQMIYGWRGADVRLILDFPQTYPDAKSVVLATNYRSTRKIVRHSRMLIEHNPERVEKDIQPQAGAARGTLDIILAQGIRAQAKAALDWIQTQQTTHNLVWDDFVILYRANSYVFPILPLLEQRGIPYVLAKETPGEEDIPPEIQPGAVTLLTIHKSKGKEFPWVVYFNLSRSGSGNIETSLPEERRVAYVGATRARHGLLITADEERYSRFLVELALSPEFDRYALPYVERQADITRKKRDRIARKLTAHKNKRESLSKSRRFPWRPRRMSPEMQDNLAHQMAGLEARLEEMEDRLDELETEIRFRKALNVKVKI